MSSREALLARGCERAMRFTNFMEQECRKALLAADWRYCQQPTNATTQTECSNTLLGTECFAGPRRRRMGADGGAAAQVDEGGRKGVEERVERSPARRLQVGDLGDK